VSLRPFVSEVEFDTKSYTSAPAHPEQDWNDGTKDTHDRLSYFASTSTSSTMFLYPPNTFCFSTIAKQTINIDFSKRLFRYSVPTIWNSLRADITIW